MNTQRMLTYNTWDGIYPGQVKVPARGSQARWSCTAGITRDGFQVYVERASTSSVWLLFILNNPNQYPPLSGSGTTAYKDKQFFPKVWWLVKPMYKICLERTFAAISFIVRCHRFKCRQLNVSILKQNVNFTSVGIDVCHTTIICFDTLQTRLPESEPRILII